MNRHSNPALESAWAPAIGGALPGFSHPLGSLGAWSPDVAVVGVCPDALHGKAEVLANALTSGDEEAEAKAMALICLLIRDRVSSALFDERMGVLPSFEAHVERVLEKVVADMEVGTP